MSAEVLGVPWEKVDVIWGDTSKHLPWTCISDGSQTIHAIPAPLTPRAWTRSKLQEIAARTWAAARRLRGRRTSALPGRGRGITFAQAAQRAIELGGMYDGHELAGGHPRHHEASATALAGMG